MFRCVGTGGELALNGCLGQHVGVGDKRVDHVDAGIEGGGQGLEGLACLRGVGVARRGLDGEVHVAFGEAAQTVNQLCGFDGLIVGDLLG